MIVGISASVEVIKEGGFLGTRKSYINEGYVKSVERVGGVPMLLPVVSDEKLISEMVDNIDALILSGGYDVSSYYYNQEPIKINETFPERDFFDFALLKYALKKGIPILGICRGMQIINVFFGGTLYQDLSLHKDSIKHDQEVNPTFLWHKVKLIENSLIYDIINQEEVMVNSFHHQGIDKVGEGLKVSARASDNLPEAIEGEGFLLGLQWHPEMLMMDEIFRGLIEEARK